MQEILNQLKTLNSNEKAVLATVVDVRGSSYRLPGAKMLIKESGETFGTVSGGCLEADVLERAKKVIETNQAFVITYDTSAKDDDVFSLRLGCNGVVRILLEKVDVKSDYVKFLERISFQTKKAVVANLISSNISTLISSKLMLESIGNFQSDFEGVIFHDELLKDCENVLMNGRSFIKKYQTENGEFEFLVEVMKPPIDLTIFGAGQDAIPLANFAKSLGWRVSIIDHRFAYANKDRFANVEKITVTRPDSFDFSTLKESSVAVLMTHDYDKDKFILSNLLTLNLNYIGALGPKRRTEDILRELGENGQTYTLEHLRNLYAPIGLDIGAETPEAIALSIIAEINSVLANREGGFLRNRQTSIYERTEHFG